MAMPNVPFSPNAVDANNPYFSDDVLARQYRMADALRHQPQATSWAGVLANGLGAVGGNLVQSSANNAIQSNQDLRNKSIQAVSGATDAPSLSKALLGSPVPELQNFGLKTHIQQVTDDPNKEYRVRAAQAAQYGLQPNTPEFRSYVLSGQLPAPKDPLDQEYKRAQIDALHNKSNDVSTPAGRAAAAQQFGLDPNSDAGRSYILTGKMPREDQQSLTATDKKAILEADEAVSSTNGAITSLQRAKELSKTAYDGATANERAWVASQFGSQAANDTRELKQTVTEGALQQLKAIFGGMPTEGERKVLLEVQGSAELPQSVREKIYDRAIGLANRRLEFNKTRAADLRGGTFYKPGGGAAPPVSAPSTSSGPIEEARAAIAAGADRNAVIQRLQQNGIDPSGL